jgi:hypothetical protein
MTAENSPAYAQGTAHHHARNAARQSCPGTDLDTYDPSDWAPWTVMYNRGWASVDDAPMHPGCRNCRDRG